MAEEPLGTDDFARREVRDSYRRSLLLMEAANHLIRTKGAGNSVLTPRMIDILIHASRLMLDTLDGAESSDEFLIDFDTDLRIMLDAADEENQG